MTCQQLSLTELGGFKKSDADVFTCSKGGADAISDADVDVNLTPLIFRVSLKKISFFFSWKLQTLNKNAYFLGQKWEFLFTKIMNPQICAKKGDADTD